MYCANCQTSVEAKIIRGADIYGPRFVFADQTYACCPFCHNFGEYVTNDEPPFNVIPDKGMRKAFNYIDAQLDLIWRQKRMSRDKVLSCMSDLMYDQKRPYRTRDIESLEEAYRAYRLAKKLREEVFTND